MGVWEIMLGGLAAAVVIALPTLALLAWIDKKWWN